ncbi:gamma-glutamyltransferase [Marinivivus vitaminiproducens]|uniref:gamma-glutamyltransferase n=1 Tax=Marinivivus vitaminiproducens TaxID=3035935 RepID=UPI0027AA5D33|nr:gamma-glutamyltransferase [Geminicoccaceae bacterium SCSIO 64248]
MHPVAARWPLVACLLCLSLAAAAQTPPAEPPPPEAATGLIAKQSVAAASAMVASAHPDATAAGLRVLEQGGNAIDAMVAVQAMLGLVEPQSSGLGGGAFLVFWDARAQRLTTYDGRETAPASATPQYFLQPDGTPKDFMAAVQGGRSVGVPGAVKLLQTAHMHYGASYWADLFLPAIEKAEQGFAVSPRLAGLLADSTAQGLDAYPEAKAYFYDEAGQPRPSGFVLKNPAYADTLRTIAAEGGDAFYRAPIAQAIVDAVRSTPDNPGELTLEDFAAYEVKERAPVCSGYRAYQVCGMGPPSSGGIAVGQILGLLDHFDMGSLGPDSVDAWHLFIEASKLAYADRAQYVADADFVSVPVQGLLDPAYLTARAQLIDRDRAMPEAKAGNPPWRDGALYAPQKQEEQPGTSHFVIVDRDGNAVSMTTTIESGFGSRLMTGGFLLNNELTDFSFVPEENGRPVANRVEGGKRPRSSMAPTIVMQDNAPHLLIGSPGGSRIIPYVAGATVGVLDWDMDLQDALDMGHVVNRNGPTELEEGTPTAALEAALAARGQEVRLAEQNSGLHAILIGSGQLTGAADSRREGTAAGN